MHFLAMKCPANSHYEACADLCSASCDGLTEIVQCATNCTEGCECNVGFLFDGQKCVKEAECGCYDNGKSYKVQFQYLCLFRKKPYYNRSGTYDVFVRISANTANK